MNKGNLWVGSYDIVGVVAIAVHGAWPLEDPECSLWCLRLREKQPGLAWVYSVIHGDALSHMSPLYITHIYISVMTHHYCVEVWNLELSSALKLTFVQFQACSVLHEAGTAWMYVFVGAIRYQARQSTDASNHASDKTLGHELPPPAPLSHCGGRLPENPPGFHGTSSSSWAMNHPITRVEFLEMTWNDRPKEATVSSGNVAYLPRRIFVPKGRGWDDLHQKDVQTCSMHGFPQDRDSKNCWRDCVLQMCFRCKVNL